MTCETGSKHFLLNSYKYATLQSISLRNGSKVILEFQKHTSLGFVMQISLLYLVAALSAFYPFFEKKGGSVPEIPMSVSEVRTGRFFGVGYFNWQTCRRQADTGTAAVEEACRSWFSRLWEQPEWIGSAARPTIGTAPTLPDTLLTQEIIVICENQQADVFGSLTNVPGIYTESYQLPNGNDSIHVIELIVHDTFWVTQQIPLCSGDSALVFGSWESQPGIYLHTFTTAQGCDSTVQLTLLRLPQMTAGFETKIACPFAKDGEITVLPSGGTPPYLYTWSTGITSHTSRLEGLDAGYYAVTLTDSLGCSTTDSVYLDAAKRPDVASSVQDVSCFGKNDGVLIIIAPDPGLLFKYGNWPIGTQKVFENVPAGGDQFFTLDTFGCIWENFFFVDYPEPVTLTLPERLKTPACEGIQIELEVSAADLTFSWSPSSFLSCTDCPNPVVSPLSNTTYYVVVTDTNGCSATDSIKVEVDFDGEIYIPNVFSPNGDGLNDVFYLFSSCVREVRLMRIFDRWGEKVFEKQNVPAGDPAYGWDGTFNGKAAGADLFVYQVIVALHNGTEAEFKGELTLLR